MSEFKYKQHHILVRTRNRLGTYSSILCFMRSGGHQEFVLMKRYLIVAATALTVGFAASALAQSAVVEIAPEQRTTIKQYVVKEKVKPVTVRERISVGATLPADVDLHPVPPAWGPAP